ncbi:putative uncharacterized protein [Clostridium sp. CAG:632]|nr:putative uncharacterized protein [Clostridium sp. CAG:632]
MGGLLYKNYVVVRGKLLVFGLLGLTILFLLLRLLLPGGDLVLAGEGYLADSMTDDAMTGFICDTGLACLLVGIEMVLIVVPLSAWTGNLLRADEKNQTRRMIQVLPFQKHAYIGSVYLFFGITYYVILSLMLFWTIIFNANAGENILQEAVSMNGQMLCLFVAVPVIILAVELPIIITLGTKKGIMIKRLFLLALVLGAFAYLLFGDLSVWTGFDLYVLINWTETHQSLVVGLEVGMPVLALVLYWLSYRLTCRLNEDREVDFYD